MWYNVPISLHSGLDIINVPEGQELKRPQYSTYRVDVMLHGKYYRGDIMSMWRHILLEPGVDEKYRWII